MVNQPGKKQQWTDKEYDEFVRDAYKFLNSAQDSAKKDFGLGNYERFDWNQDKGTLIFSDRGVTKVIVDVQFVGSISKKSNTWLWSWENETILPSVKNKILEVKRFGEIHELPELTTAKWNAKEEDGWAMTAIAAKILQAKGAYRTPDENGFLFMIFTNIRWSDNTKSIEKKD